MYISIFDRKYGLIREPGDVYMYNIHMYSDCTNIYIHVRSLCYILKLNVYDKDTSAGCDVYLGIRRTHMCHSAYIYTHTTHTYYTKAQSYTIHR